MSMQLLRAAQHRRMAWKNGAGETTEIAVWPPGAGLDDFEWRISMAHVTRDGPFSVFAGVERTLTVLEGDGLRLAIGDAAPVDLHVGDAPLSFPADVPTTATLLGGAVTDLNVMTRRGRWQHAVERHRIQVAQTLAGTAASRLWLCSDGALHMCGTAGSTDLGAGDACLVVDPEASPWRLDVQGTGTLWRIALVRRAVEPPEA